MLLASPLFRISFEVLFLTHFRPSFHFYTTRKHQLRFCDVFRGYRSGTLVENGLNLYLGAFFLQRDKMKKYLWKIIKNDKS